MMTPTSSSATVQNSYAQDCRDASVGDFVTLLKPGVLSLVVFTAFIGALLAPGHVHPYVLFISLLSIALGAGGAAAFNMWYDRDIDLIMTRTQKRPIPAGRIAPQDGLCFSVLLCVTSLTLMALATNFLAAALLCISILYYTFFYTAYLKRRTAQNIVIGGGAGAFPPLIGWVSVTGDVGILPLLLFWIIFIWTPSHFWALSLYRCQDYTLAGVPMLPVTRGIKVTKQHIVVYSLALVISALLPWGLGYLGPLYGAVSLVLGAVYLELSRRVIKGGEKEAIRLFLFSIAYLFVLFLSMIVDYLVRTYA